MSAAAISSDFLPPFQASARPGTFSESPRTRAARGPVLEFVVGDLTRETSDAIVNPAGAGMVDLAIRRAAGPELLEAFHQSALEASDREALRGTRDLDARLRSGRAAG